jgi:ssDNA-binding Zn-finger/Zn-ribbon topoisomerase 1
MNIVKNCPDCGKPMAERVNKVNGSTFLGCSQYPVCTHTEPIPETLKLRNAGYKDMFEDEEDSE